MLRRNRELFMQVLQVVDALLAALALWLAWLTRTLLIPQVPFTADLPLIEPFEAFSWMWLIIVPATPLLLEANGYYRFTWSSKLWSVLRATLGLLLLLSLALLLLKFSPSRGVLVLTGFWAATLLCLRDWLLRHWFLTHASRSTSRETLLIACPVSRLESIQKQVGSQPEGVLTSISHFDIERMSASDLSNMLHLQNVDRVVISAGNLPFDRVAEYIKACEIEGVEVWLLSDFYQASVARASFDEFLGVPTLVFRSTPDVSWQLLFKSVFDRVASLLLLLCCFPLMILIACAICATSPGPAVFRQRRGGLHGRPFTMFKFRTMHRDAEAVKESLLASNELDGPAFKLESDPRVTRLGRWLRRTSLDELPQLLNVLRGEMSLVGPRPLPVEEVAGFTDLAHRRRLSMKPGMTCLWQISGRNNIRNFDDWVKLDLQYIDRWNLWLDFKILAFTLPVVILGRGAV